LYAYLQQERFDSARQILDVCAQEMRSRQSPATVTDPYSGEPHPVAAYYSARARFLIESEAWDDAYAKVDDAPVDLPSAEFVRDATNAFVLLRKNEKQADSAVARAERSANHLLAAGKQFGLADDHPSQEATRIQLDELRALLQLREGQRDLALKLLQDAARREEALPMDFGPPTITKPANELLGEVLLGLGRAEAARDAFDKAQRLAPGRTRSLLGLSKCAALLKDEALAASVNTKLEQTRKEAQRAKQS
jgi:tetratricopeptide (TPR) repeat protein